MVLGRPDMALFLYKAIINKQPIEIFNNGEMLRDFTYIDDIIESLNRVILKYQSQIIYSTKNYLYHQVVGLLIEYLILAIRIQL